MKPIAIIALFVSIIVIFMIMYCRFANAADITLQWDYPDDSKVDGFIVFMRTVGVDYDYNTPLIKTGPTARAAKVSVKENPGEITSYFFVARAFRADRQSDNSNECETKIDLAPIEKPKDFKCFIEGAQ